MDFTHVLIEAVRGHKISGPGWDDGQYFYMDKDTYILKYFNENKEVEDVEVYNITIWSCWKDWEIKDE